MSQESDFSQASTDVASDILQESPDVSMSSREEPSVGKQLRNGREAKGMTLGDVAERLKLSPRQVEALENDDWSRLQCNTITRGFVRNYARLVGLDAADLMLALDRIAKPQQKELNVPVSINVKVPSEHGVARRDYFRVVGGLLILMIAVLVYFFLPPDLVQSTYAAIKERLTSKPSASVLNVAGPEVVPAVTQPVATLVAAAEAPPSAQTLPAASQSGGLVEAPAVQANKSENVLKFSFSKPSWVEVKDKSGQIVFSQLSPAGSLREVSGQPPFSVVVGNAGNVTLQYKGKDVDLTKRSKDDVARLILE